jgi:glycosyltransferase involved in cell wall biosynthesis
MPSLRSRPRRAPLVSLVLCTKNGMPFVRDALTSVAGQTYDRFELVVQDAVSTDGTPDAIREAGIPRTRMVSTPDGGIGDAYNRAFGRCRGSIVGTIDADNVLERDAVEQAVALFAEHPDAAAVYGAAKMIDEHGVGDGEFVPGEFDRAALMRCELVPPFGQAFFSKRVCGSKLRFDPRLATCADFDLWLRLSHLPVIRTETVVGSVRLSGRSMTRRAANYDQFCADKLSALDWHVARHPELAPDRDEAAAGIYCWAAESLIDLEGDSDGYRAALANAEALAPTYERVARARELASCAAS